LRIVLDFADESESGVGMDGAGAFANVTFYLAVLARCAGFAGAVAVVTL